MREYGGMLKRYKNLLWLFAPNPHNPHGKVWHNDLELCYEEVLTWYAAQRYIQMLDDNDLDAVIYPVHGSDPTTIGAFTPDFSKPFHHSLVPWALPTFIYLKLRDVSRQWLLFCKTLANLDRSTSRSDMRIASSTQNHGSANVRDSVQSEIRMWLLRLGLQQSQSQWVSPRMATQLGSWLVQGTSTRQPYLRCVIMIYPSNADTTPHRKQCCMRTESSAIAIANHICGQALIFQPCCKRVFGVKQPFLDVRQDYVTAISR